MNSTNNAHSTDATRQFNAATDAMRDGMNSFNGFAKTLATTMEAWMGVQRRAAESMVNAMAANAAMPGFAPFGAPAASPFSAPGAGVADAEQVRSRVAGAMHRSIETAASASAEFAAIVADQARFAGRVVERSVDCVFGPHAARSPEAIAATGRTLVSDCMDNGVATSERAMRVGTVAVERMQEVGIAMTAAMGMPFVASVNAATTGCCGGKATATAEPVTAVSEKTAVKSAR